MTVLIAINCALAFVLFFLLLWVVLRLREIGGEQSEENRKKELERIQEEAARTAQNLNDGIAGIRRELNEGFAGHRREITENFTAQAEMTRRSFSDFIKFLDQLKASALEENRNARREQSEFQNKFQENINRQLEQNRQTADQRLKAIQEENRQKLDEMKKTVDEKLQESMDKHFNESFKLISERLEQVHKGLGEMQSIAAGVGDLKKVLTNVKTRGNIGEIQLSAILEQYLTPDQYVTNIATVPDSREVVEFAIKMPGSRDGDPVLLPIDSKFPVEDYLRLQESYDQWQRNSPEVKKAQEAFARAVKKNAGDIHDKYLYPPFTTAFGIMFVPSEGIYAEILRQPGLFEALQSQFNIVVAGPTNLVAFLNALQMGFKTLALEKRSNEVWRILGAVKTEFHKFGDQMDATRKSLQSVVNHVDRIGIRSRALERQLGGVRELPEAETAELLKDSEEVPPAAAPEA